MDLVNKTMEWIGKELKDEIDFVIWTGDSARHDNDDEFPRSEEQVIGLNQMMVDKMFETFGKHNGDEEDEDPNNDYVIPIIPNLGNNDILPHNIFRRGPHKWTRTYAKLWRQFIPEEQKHQFEQGGWFSVEVIPRKLAVFSLNTLYFFKSNAAVDGCAVKSEPGYQHMEWLRIQLQFMRDRGMKAIIVGHVPPVREESKITWDETCWQKYTLWTRQYRDVIVSSHYGHFNYDHFILQDYDELRKGTKKGKMPDYEFESASTDDIHAQVSSDYFIDLRQSWSKIPGRPKSLSWFEQLQTTIEDLRESPEPFSLASSMLINLSKSKKKRKDEEKKYLKAIGGEYAERFAASFVGASIVPNLFPTLRVYEYNITGLEKHRDEDDIVVPDLRLGWDSNISEDDSIEIAKKKKYKFEIPDGPSKSSPPGPAYSPQTLSLVRYKQYFANLTHINNDFHGLNVDSEVEEAGEVHSAKWKEGKHKGKTKPKDHEPAPKKFKFELHYDTKDDNVYKLPDLTMPNLVDLARRIGEYAPDDIADEYDQEVAVSDDSDVVPEKKKKHKHKKSKKHNEAWFAFVRRAFVETLTREELEEQFG